MIPFLKKVLQEIIQKHPSDLDQICIVLPGKRPAVYLRKYFGELLSGTNWLPDMLAINQFVEVVTNQRVTDKNELLFHFFSLYQKQTYYKKKETFDEFLMWAPQVIADFNDVDNYLQDGKYIFQDLTNIKEMDDWGRENLEDENYSWSFNSDPLSLQQQDFLSFWSKIGKLYQVLRTYCIEKEHFYSGLLNRLLAENLVEKEHLILKDDAIVSTNSKELIYSKLNKWNKIYFVGLNALSSAEEKFVFSLVKSGKAETYWDSDSLYMENNVHEAGLFLRRYKKKLPHFNWKTDHFTNSELKVNIHEFGSDSAQIKYAGTLLQEQSELNKAIILANENLLIPLLISLPELENKVNITLGYPLANTPFYSWVIKTIHLLKSNEKKIYHLDFLEWISHPFVSTVLLTEDDTIVKKFGQQLISDNTMFVSEKHLTSMGKESEVLQAFFEILIHDNKELDQLINYLDGRLQVFKNVLEKQKMHIESLFEFSKILNRLSDYAERFDFVKSLETFEKLFIKISSAGSLSFLGEPLQGSQIMGMLESRTLDFDHIIVLGANEGFLPSPKNVSSFIPFDLKRFYGLPTHKENEAIFAYNFYRILQRASRADICYSAISETFGRAEASRYIFQIKNEFPELIAQVNSDVIMTKLSEQKNNDISIEVTEEISKQVIEKLKSGISPSAFNTFLRCPLDFYYKYIAGFNEVEEVEENIQLNTFGTIVHRVLEDFYNEILGKSIEIQHIDDWEKRIDTASIEVFTEHFKARNFTEGTNYIALEVARRYLKDFFVKERAEIEKLAKTNEVVRIVALEKSLTFDLDLSKHGYNEPIRIRGFADRIDVISGVTRIIDYKTGGTEVADVTIKYDFSNLMGGKKPKALQVLLYSYLYHKMENVDFYNIESGIISFKNINNGFMKFGIKKPTNKETAAGEEMPDDIVEELEKNIAAIACEMIKVGQVWRHEESSDFCGYC